MEITYGKGWFWARKRITDVWDERKAKKAHDGRQLYAALVKVGSKAFVVEACGNRSPAKY